MWINSGYALSKPFLNTFRILFKSLLEASQRIFFPRKSVCLYLKYYVALAKYKRIDANQKYKWKCVCNQISFYLF